MHSQELACPTKCLVGWAVLSADLECVPRGSFATVKEGIRKDTGQKVAIKVIDKKDAVFDAESLEQEVMCLLHSAVTFCPC